MGSKLVLKGELALSALYRGQDQQLHTYETELPVSQILDGADLPEEGELSGILCLTGGEVRVLRSDSGGGFSISAELRLLLRAYRTVRCSCVEDLYSIRRPVQLHQETVAVPVGGPAAPCGRRAFSIWTSAAAARSSLSPTRTAHLLP